MTTTPDHIVGFKIDVFDNEWRPLLKLFNRAMADKNIMESFNAEELDRLETFVDWFKEECLKNGA